ncbi:NADH-ubiquinone oxidoreductase-F iron-sulfur binding region domain-containing protein [Candidatus Puniceispirillum sp.]|uniref:NAD(P)H-dependent oxidoreductase subunit E n=1 Tax=Candidatus Puniceispirillum sp. TaxID=2026719 RepID=UPI001EBE3C43|nr:NADH-quinone oxidoreductase subunit F [Candidatus Puniceispirillum sp.]
MDNLPNTGRDKSDDFSSAGAPSRGKGRYKPKGRMLDPIALDEVRALLGNIEPARDMLIEYLHMIQDNQKHLSARHLAALAHIMRIPMAEVWEVASFYDHFDLVKEDETAPPQCTVRVCTSLSCMMVGGETMLEKLQPYASDKVRFVPAPCIGACDKAPAAAIGHKLIEHASFDALKDVEEDGHPEIPATARRFDAYVADGGYSLLKALLSGKKNAEDVLSVLDDAALRGLGGAGFPTGRKWRIVSGQPGPRLMAVNGDEGEPGTFKDRLYLSNDPHRMIEGILIATKVVGIDACYIYMRDEYPEIIALLKEELAAVEAAGLADHTQLHLRRGAGAYICGEESAMIESIEGKRGLPRHRPPFVAEKGIFDRPTLVNNVETLYWIRDIVEQGADWFNDQGKDGHPGPRSYSVSGRVAKPGVIMAPAGSTVSELIALCGGMAEGHSFKGYLPGGASGGILPASKGDIPLDFGGALAEEGCFVGSHAVVVLSDQDNMWDAATNLLKFFAHESCGQCTPCRNGTEKAVTLMQSANPDVNLLGELSIAMGDASICGLGQAASNPLTSVMKHFPEDIVK